MTIDAVNGPNNANGDFKLNESKYIKETPNSILSGKFQSQQNDFAAFDKDISQSKLDDRIPNKSSLAKMGFGFTPRTVTLPGGRTITTSNLDMNGGLSYFNDKGDSIRISNDTLEGGTGATQVDYTTKDKSIEHSIVYDKGGNPLKGYLNVRQPNGTVVKYKYEYDMNGNKNLVSCTTEYPKKMQ
ncbi:MAG: hypothetical protein LKG27_01660 [Clostridiaceae bacterium]|jgi:hypothetical protein|nr:hypothetical protein [Clostridiaceae bacterium]